MKSVTARQLVSSSNSSVYEVTSEGCAACIGCRSSIRITLPGVSAPMVAIEMTTRNEWFLLVNSWVKPLLAVVLMSFFCTLAGVAEPVSIGLVLVAFLAGVVSCQRMPASTITSSAIAISKHSEKG